MRFLFSVDKASGEDGRGYGGRGSGHGGGSGYGGDGGGGPCALVALHLVSNAPPKKKTWKTGIDFHFT